MHALCISLNRNSLALQSSRVVSTPLNMLLRLQRSLSNDPRARCASEPFRRACGSPTLQAGYVPAIQGSIGHL